MKKSNESISLDAWEQAWQKHWKKTGFTSYELHLPDSDAANRERNFLTQKRSAEREKARLKRITAEFERGFKRLGKLGPFPLVLLGREFWTGMRDFLLFMVEQGVFETKEVGFARIVDSPAEAVEMVVRALPASVREHLSPLTR